MRTLVLTFFLILLCRSSFAQSPSPVIGPTDLYFLAIGMGNYPDGPNTPLSSSADSAEVVADALVDAGARFGYVLASRPEDGAFVTREDVRQAIVALKARIRADGTRHARVLVYLMAHGTADGAAQYAFALPDELALQEQEIDQDYVWRLARRAVWNVDLLASFMSFRRDSRFEELDDDFRSDLLSDRLRIAGQVDHFRNKQEYDRQLAQSSSRFGPSPLDNAPIPFVLLLDICAGGVNANITGGNFFLDIMAKLVYQTTLDVGLAFHAVPFGQLARPLQLHADLTEPRDKIISQTGEMIAPTVGPLAVHLKVVLAARDPNEPMSLEAFGDALAAAGAPAPDNLDLGLPLPPFRLPDRLRPDVAQVDFLPADGGSRGSYEVLPPTGTVREACCIQIGPLSDSFDREHP